ncbi:nitrite/sulfite reductase [Marichromatium sp. PS1]|uniref:nitrite/sulfite reductase n=1 Tax=Marichromatium sp. PS1 TaxID=3138932 RepID=UPI0032E6C437
MTEQTSAAPLDPRRRVEHFRDLTRDYLDGRLSEEAFRPLRLMHGLYRLRETTMLRVAVRDGRLDAAQLRALARIAHRRGLGGVRLTTRQNLQFSGPAIAEVPEILAELAEVGLSSFMTSGGCVRGITLDPLAGVACDELEDPRPWRALLDRWRETLPLASRLPGKFKIAINGAREDRVALAAHDLGLDLVRDARGELGFRVLVGGGLGRDARLAEELTGFLHWPHLLTYSEAVLRVHARDGGGARLRTLVRRIGMAAFADRVAREWAGLRDGPGTLDREQVAAAAHRFAVAPVPAEAPAQPVATTGPADYRDWVATNVRAQRDPERAIVTLSTKGRDVLPGWLSAAQLEWLAGVVETASDDEARLTGAQQVVLPRVRRARLFELWAEARAQGLAEANVGLLTDLVACPGIRECDLAHGDPQSIAAAIRDRFQDRAALRDIGPLTLRISGCPNACVHHNLADIGIRGLRKQGGARYQVLIGGHGGRGARLGEPLGASFAAAEVPEVIDTLLGVHHHWRLPGEPFAGTVRRVGTAPFRAALELRAAAASREVAHG